MIKGCLYAVFSAFCFGMIAILVKLSYQAGLRDMQLLAIRWLSGAAMLFFYLLLRDPGLLKANLRTIAKAAVLGAAFHFLGSMCFFKSLKYIPAATASLILYCYPVVVTLISGVVFRMRIERFVAISLALTTAGCSLVFYDAFLKALDATGIVLAGATMITFSVCMIFTQIFLRGERPLTMSFYMVLSAGIAFTVAGGGIPVGSLDARQWAQALSLGLVSTAIAYVFHFRAVETVGSAYTSIFSTFEPITTVAMAFAVLGEDIVLLQVAGVRLIVAGIVMPNLREWRAMRLLR